MTFISDPKRSPIFDWRWFLALELIFLSRFRTDSIIRGFEANTIPNYSTFDFPICLIFGFNLEVLTWDSDGFYLFYIAFKCLFSCYSWIWNLNFKTFLTSTRKQLKHSKNEWKTKWTPIFPPCNNFKSYIKLHITLLKLFNVTMEVKNSYFL